MDKNEVKLLLKELNLHPRKSLGQNFIINNQILFKLISEADISNQDVILEVGPGLGALTVELVKTAGKVIAVEIENRLYDFLQNKFSDLDNLKLINGDILEIALPYHNKVVSNIPYSITGPLFEKLFFKKDAPEGILIIEKNIADRILYTENYKNFSRITVSVNSFMKSTYHRKISKNVFYPRPKIDLTLIHLFPREDLDPLMFHDEFKQFYLQFIAGIMPYKNKNMVNAIYLYTKRYMNNPLNKHLIKSVLKRLNFKNLKVFEFKIEQFMELGIAFYELNHP